MANTTIAGRAIVFNAWSLDLGGFRERIAPQAIDRTLREGHDLRALWSHDPSQPLARLHGSGTLRVAKDRQGLAVEIDLPSSRGDVAELVERRDLGGMSFGFQAIADAWEDGPVPERTVLDMLVREVSPVTWPAYPQTSVRIQAPSAGRSLPTLFSLATPERDQEARSMEYAMERTSQGEKMPHSAAQRSLERFLAAKAERGERDSRPMVYRSVCRAGTWEGEWVPRASVVDGLLKQAEERRSRW